MNLYNYFSLSFNNKVSLDAVVLFLKPLFANRAPGVLMKCNDNTIFIHNFDSLKQIVYLNLRSIVKSLHNDSYYI